MDLIDGDVSSRGAQLLDLSKWDGDLHLCGFRSGVSVKISLIDEISLMITLKHIGSLLVTFVFSIALDVIGWRIYMISGVWDVLELLFVIFYWVETKGRTLEEVDELINGVKHSNMPDLKALRQVKLNDDTEMIVGQVITREEGPMVASGKKE
jgi:hypothetical protein